MRAIAVDPGGTTGFAKWDDGVWSAWAEALEPAQDTFHTILRGPWVDLVVFESFHIGANTIKKGRSGPNDAIEFIGVGRYLCRYYDIDFETQSPSEAKTFSTDDKLRHYGWWTKGLDHPRDASRHLMLALAKRRLIDLKDLIT